MLNLSLNYIKNNETYKKLYGDNAPLVITPWKTWGENERVKIFLSFGATEAKPPEEVDAIIDNKTTDVMMTTTARPTYNKCFRETFRLAETASGLRSSA